jgi:hypothetical protein
MGIQRKENKKKKKKCIECGSVMELVIFEDDGVSYEGYRCTKCYHEVVTLEQMRAYIKARELKKALPEKRKVVKIGDSFGIILPYSLRAYGLKYGQYVDVSVIDENNIKLTLKK